MKSFKDALIAIISTLLKGVPRLDLIEVGRNVSVIFPL
jgi:hypothetical protein